jgi:hypothetical protein
MSAFLTRLGAHAPADGPRTWLYVPYDQLTDAVGPLSRLAPEEAGVVLVETRHKPGRRRYHKQKLLWVLANQRHFALEQAERGVAVDYRFDDRPYGEVLRDVVADRGCATSCVRSWGPVQCGSCPTRAGSAARRISSRSGSRGAWTASTDGSGSGRVC